MPIYAPAMKYIMLTKTHFCHVHKLVADGNRTQINKAGGLPAKLSDGDAEGLMIQEYGVEAIVYSSSLWSDVRGKQAIMIEDNLDANCRLGESELDAYICG